MSFQYSCFLSFRHHLHSQLNQRMIKELHDALRGELAILTNKPVFVDWDRLKGGDLYNETIAHDLCRSVCMVMVYTPVYFNETHSYCAREYKAMERLEKARLAKVKDPQNKRRGLIIPVVLRGEKNLPAEIKDRRHYYNFESFALTDRVISKHKKYAPVVRDIANRVVELCDVYDRLGTDVCRGCDKFILPTDQDIKPWLRSVLAPPLPFPGRKATG